MADNSVIFSGALQFVEEPRQTTFVLRTNNGKTCELRLGGDKLEVSGTLPLSEAAKVFFEYVRGYMAETIEDRAKELAEEMVAPFAVDIAGPAGK